MIKEQHQGTTINVTYDLQSIIDHQPTVVHGKLHVSRVRKAIAIQIQEMNNLLNQDKTNHSHNENIPNVGG
jgi:hypothetical protein